MIVFTRANVIKVMFVCCLVMQAAAANRRLYACDLPKSLTEDQLRGLFHEEHQPVSIIFALGPTSKKLGSALLIFATPVTKDLVY